MKKVFSLIETIMACLQGSINMLRFLLHKTSNKTVVIVEFNPYHFETIPGYYKYFKDLGFDIEIIRLKKLGDPFFRLKEKIKIWNFSRALFIRFIVRKNFLFKYNYIFFNSISISNNTNNIQEFIEKNYFSKDKVLLVQHTITEKIDNSIILANPIKNLDYERFVVNPHYFGDINITPKNKITHFISVGALVKYRKNSSLLINAVEELIRKNITNFKVILIGTCDENIIPENILEYFDIRGRVGFYDLYLQLEKSDYFLTLLDPKTPDHNNYITVKTSGTFQLVYGFRKPQIIHKKFADVYNFTNKDSIVYENNEDLSKAMIEAINETAESYESKQNAIKSIADTIYKKSLENLKGLLK